MGKLGFDPGPFVLEARVSVWDPWCGESGFRSGPLSLGSQVFGLGSLAGEDGCRPGILGVEKFGFGPCLSFFCSQGLPWDLFLACLTICIGVSLQTVVKSYYELLGLKSSDDMTSKDIKKAFRKRSLVSHPDKCKPQSALQDPWPWQNVVLRVPCFELVLLTLGVQSRRADSRPQVGTQLSSFS